MAQFANIPVLKFLLSSEKGRRKSKVITHHFSKVQEQHLHPKTKKSRCHSGDDFGDDFDIFDQFWLYHHLLLMAELSCSNHRLDVWNLINNGWWKKFG